MSNTTYAIGALYADVAGDKPYLIQQVEATTEARGNEPQKTHTLEHWIDLSFLTKRVVDGRGHRRARKRALVLFNLPGDSNRIGYRARWFPDRRWDSRGGTLLVYADTNFGFRFQIGSDGKAITVSQLNPMQIPAGAFNGWDLMTAFEFRGNTDGSVTKGAVQLVFTDLFDPINVGGMFRQTTPGKAYRRAYLPRSTADFEFVFLPEREGHSKRWSAFYKSGTAKLSWHARPAEDQEHDGWFVSIYHRFGKAKKGAKQPDTPEVERGFLLLGPAAAEAAGLGEEVDAAEEHEGAEEQHPDATPDAEAEDQPQQQ